MFSFSASGNGLISLVTFLYPCHNYSNFVNYLKQFLDDGCMMAALRNEFLFILQCISLTLLFCSQDSPVFSYISNLSPIQPVKAAPVVQGFPGLNSPPLLFTSPRVSAHSRLRRCYKTVFKSLLIYDVDKIMLFISVRQKLTISEP